MSKPKQGTGGVYFGCDGEYKLNVEPKMKCWNNGYRCPDIDAWKKENRKGNKNKYESCFGDKDRNRDYPPASCPAGQLLPNVCPEDRMLNGALNTGGVPFWKGKAGGSGNQGACIIPVTKDTTKDTLWPSAGCDSTYNLSEGWKLAKAITDCDREWGEEVTRSFVCGNRDNYNCTDTFKACRRNADCVIIQLRKKDEQGYYNEKICQGDGNCNPPPVCS